ncbi:MAG: lipase family protein [Flavobacteriia bacterium]|nr:lipase family protein [Flavobacteriia bacterium]OJX37273.1 MAG: hypothetical protein BGO87_01120 [Flavobacteriia bacterium 40-80]
MNRILLFLSLITCNVALSQLKPGFDKQEYLELLQLTAHNSEPEYAKTIPYPDGYERIYASSEFGLQNKWEFWAKGDTGVISLRASVAGPSWIGNFYAAMIPAKGNLVIDSQKTISYQFAENEMATTHVGWSLGAILLLENILPTIDSCYQKGMKNFFIIGHSQGGALANLIHSLIYYKQKDGRLPSDIVFKSYCSAQPKVGNLYYSYDFEAAHLNWSYTILNSRDWVPEAPFSIQTTDDFNKVNGFKVMKLMIKKQPLFRKMVLKSLYNKLDKPPKKARKNFIKILGSTVYKFVNKELKDFPKPTYSNNMNYTRCGTPIILNQFDETYDRRFPDSDLNMMVHHSYEAYFYLLEKLSIPSMSH